MFKITLPISFFNFLKLYFLSIFIIKCASLLRFSVKQHTRSTTMTLQKPRLGNIWASSSRRISHGRPTWILSPRKPTNSLAFHVPTTKPFRLPPRCKGPVLQDAGQTHPRLCRVCMGFTPHHVYSSWRRYNVLQPGL